MNSMVRVKSQMNGGMLQTWAAFLAEGFDGPLLHGLCPRNKPSCVCHSRMQAPREYVSRDEKNRDYVTARSDVIQTCIRKI